MTGGAWWSTQDPPLVIIAQVVPKRGALLASFDLWAVAADPQDGDAPRGLMAYACVGEHTPMEPMWPAALRGLQQCPCGKVMSVIGCPPPLMLIPPIVHHKKK